MFSKILTNFSYLKSERKYSSSVYVCIPVMQILLTWTVQCFTHICTLHENVHARCKVTIIWGRQTLNISSKSITGNHGNWAAIISNKKPSLLLLLLFKNVLWLKKKFKTIRPSSAIFDKQWIKEAIVEMYTANVWRRKNYN